MNAIAEIVRAGLMAPATIDAWPPDAVDRVRDGWKVTLEAMLRLRQGSGVSRVALASELDKAKLHTDAQALGDLDLKGEPLTSGEIERRWRGVPRRLKVVPEAAPNTARGKPGAPTPKATLLERYGIVRASTIAEEPTEWDWEGYLVRGAVNLIEGNPETGKTLFVLMVAANLSSGRPLPFGRAEPERARRVLYLTAEDSIAKTIVGRLKAAGANLENVLVQKERGADLYFSGARLAELRQIVSGEGISAIVLDPLNAYLDGVDINKEQEVRKALRPMRDFAEDENASIDGLRHLNKASDKPALYRGGGSIALTAVARSTLLVARHPDDPSLRVLLSQKCNLIESEKRPPRGFHIEKDSAGRPRIEWEKEAVEIDADELLGPKKPGPTPTMLEKAKTYITDHLRGGEKARKDIVDSAVKLGISIPTMDRAARDLGVVSRPNGKERLWSL